MNEMNVDWDDLKLFLAVARNKGLSGAARQTGSSAPTLGRRMQALETATGIEIFERHARGYDLTTEGQAFFDRVLEVEAKIHPLVTSHRDNPRTLVKLSAGQWTLHALSRHIQRITDAAPDALLRFISSDDYLNINHREAVIGVRNQRPHQAGLACRRIGTISFAGYATDPSVNGWIIVASNAPSARWLAAQTEITKVIEVNSTQLAKDLAEQGVGRVVLPSFIGDHVPSLMRVVDPIAELDHDQWLVSHHEDRFIPAVRQVLDETYDVLRSIAKEQST